MATEQLVRSEIDAGLRLVTALDEAGFGVAAALWLYSSDLENWKFVIATKAKPAEIEGKYLEAATIASRWRAQNPERPILDLSWVRIVSVDDPLIKGLRPILRVDGLSEVRFSHNMINGIYVEDALIHRLAA